MGNPAVLDTFPLAPTEESHRDARRSASDESIRFGLIGAGYIAAYHARAILATDSAELVWVASRSGESSRALTRTIGAGRSTIDLQRVVDDPSVDAVVVATPNGLHEEHAVAALRAGKAVLVEKPLAATLEEARRIAAVAGAERGFLQVGHMWRHDLEAQWIRDSVAAGEIGRVYRSVSYGIHERWGPDGWFVDPKLAGGGALLDMGVHAVDTTRFLLGDPIPQSVYARISTEHGDYAVDDTALVIVTWEDGVVSTIESGWWQPHSDGPEAATRLYGTHGFASLFPTYVEAIDRSPNRFDGSPYDAPKRVQPTFPPRSEHCDQRMYTAQIAAFVRDLRRHRRGEAEHGREDSHHRSRTFPGTADESEMAAGLSHAPSWEPGLTVMEIVDAAYRSAESGRTVRLSNGG